jgi:hypothetical protein
MTCVCGEAMMIKAEICRPLTGEMLVPGAVAKEKPKQMSRRETIASQYY